MADIHLTPEQELEAQRLAEIILQKAKEERCTSRSTARVGVGPSELLACNALQPSSCRLSPGLPGQSFLSSRLPGPGFPVLTRQHQTAFDQQGVRNHTGMAEVPPAVELGQRSVLEFSTTIRVALADA